MLARLVFAGLFAVKYLASGPNPTIVSYSATVKIYNATSSLVRFKVIVSSNMKTVAY
jgi:hypothetical protein